MTDESRAKRPRASPSMNMSIRVDVAHIPADAGSSTVPNDQHLDCPFHGDNKEPLGHEDQSPRKAPTQVPSLVYCNADAKKKEASRRI